MKNRALVLSGGGANGSYQVGAIKYLVEEMKLDYTIFAGVSVGSINCAHMAMYRTGHLHTGSKKLRELWGNLNTKNVYKRWFPFGKLHALWKQSLYNTAPLQKLIREKLQPKQILMAGHKLRIGAVSMKTGQYKVFDETYHDLAGAVLASSAFPLAFCPIELDGELYLDGGIRNIIPITAAVQAGATELDVIITEPPDKPVWDKNSPKTLDLGMRTLSIMVDEITDNDILIPQLINGLVEVGKSNKKLIKINLIRPEKELGDSFDFSPKLNMERAQKGYDDAKKVVKE